MQALPVLERHVLRISFFPQACCCGRLHSGVPTTRISRTSLSPTRCGTPRHRAPRRPQPHMRLKRTAGSSLKPPSWPIAGLSLRTSMPKRALAPLCGSPDRPYHPELARFLGKRAGHRMRVAHRAVDGSVHDEQHQDSVRIATGERCFDRYARKSERAPGHHGRTRSVLALFLRLVCLGVHAAGHTWGFFVECRTERSISAKLWPRPPTSSMRAADGARSAGVRPPRDECGRLSS